MHLTPFVETLQRELAIAAAAGGDDARALADRLTAPLDAATRLVLLEALSSAADEITRELAPGSVEVRLRGRDPGFVVTPPPHPTDDDANVADTDAGMAPPVAPPSLADPDGGTARLNLRLPDSLKQRIEEAATQEGLSLNAWLVRAAAGALETGPARNRGGPVGNRRYSGWVR
ncbi:MAG TPA: YlcI/YnfO family protein [Egicoccus sp.]|nr:YlcI/YnfO family protein [Egicoccus sp.]HSK23010.1 YlcI/YnfO family protein [Egicoccus sp.]